MHDKGNEVTSDYPNSSDREQIRKLIADIYRGGLVQSIEEFKCWALRRIQELIPFDAAIFASGNSHQGKFHAWTAIGLPKRFLRSLEETHSDNPLLGMLIANYGKSLRICDLSDEAGFYQSMLYRRCFAHYGVERILTTAFHDDKTGIETLISLYRADRNNEFSEKERLIQEDLAFHLLKAYSHVFFLLLWQRARMHAERLACVVDASGIVLEAQSGLVQLLEKAGVQIKAGKVPFPINEGCFQIDSTHLKVKISHFGDLFLAEIWPEGVLDELTTRERNVVDAACRGLSDKEIANEFGVSRPTVSSHLHRAYKKLGVSSRRGLRLLLGARLGRSSSEGRDGLTQ